MQTEYVTEPGSSQAAVGMVSQPFDPEAEVASTHQPEIDSEPLVFPVTGSQDRQ